MQSDMKTAGKWSSCCLLKIEGESSFRLAGFSVQYPKNNVPKTMSKKQLLGNNVKETYE